MLRLGERRKGKIRQERSSLIVDFAKDSILRGLRASQSTPSHSLNFKGWRPAPLRAPRTPVFPISSPSFRTSSLATYLCFLVDSNTLKYI
uniref:Uncharacterized protein n=1 Tax=Solanum tuberosum TaxID=4113 RepID=M1DHT3_SOLTU